MDTILIVLLLFPLSSFVILCIIWCYQDNKTTKWKIYEYKDEEGNSYYEVSRKLKGNLQYLYFTFKREELIKLTTESWSNKYSNLEHVFYAIEEMNKIEKFKNYKRRIK